MKLTKTKLILGGVVALLVIAAIDQQARPEYYAEINAEAKARQANEDAAKAEAKEAREAIQAGLHKLAHPEESMKITKMDWEKGGFGSIMLANFTVKNDNGLDVKDFTISCETEAPSGTVLSTPSQIVYETIPSKKERMFFKINMGFVNDQSQKAGCKVTKAVVVAPETVAQK